MNGALRGSRHQLTTRMRAIQLMRSEIEKQNIPQSRAQAALTQLTIVLLTTILMLSLIHI